MRINNTFKLERKKERNKKMSKRILNFDVGKIILILLFFILIRQSTTSSGSTRETFGPKSSTEKQQQQQQQRLIVNTYNNEKLSKEDCSTMSWTNELDEDRREFSCFLNRIVQHELSLSTSCGNNDTLCSGEEALNAMLKGKSDEQQKGGSEKQSSKKIKIKYDYKNQKGLLYYSFDVNGTLISLKHHSHKPFIVKSNTTKTTTTTTTQEENSNQMGNNNETSMRNDLNALNEQIADYESNVHLLESLLSTIKKQLKVLTKNKKLMKKMDHKLTKVEKKMPTTTSNSSNSAKSNGKEIKSSSQES